MKDKEIKEILDKYFESYEFYAERARIREEIESIAEVEEVDYKALYREWELQALGFPPLRDVIRSEHFKWLLNQNNTI